MLLSKIALVSLFIFVGCGYNNTKLPADNSLVSKPDGSNGASGALDFATIKAQVFEPNCIRCHSAAGGNRAGINLETYSSVQPLVQTILSVVSSGAMPPSGGMAANLKASLVAWIQAGAPEIVDPNGAPVGGGVAPPPTSPPVPCPEHLGLIENGKISDIDKNFFIEYQSQTIQRRNDDCEDR